MQKPESLEFCLEILVVTVGMNQTAVVLLHLLVILGWCSWNMNAVGNFTEVPQNTTCVLGQTFSVRCQPPLHSSGARWMYGEERLFVTHPPAGINATSRGILFQLLITCTLERHYITVQCIAIVVLGVKEEESPAALIRVQGLPDQVESVNTWSNFSSIVLLWDSGPTGLHSTYCVAVYNTTAARNSNASMETCMLREPSFTLTDTAASPLHTFEFVVTAVSELGRGPPSSAIAARFTFVGNFTEVPQNTTCVLGQTFSIRCQPPLHSSGARWMYGEERLFVTHPPAGINATSRGILFQLLITCTLERHYITVQCIAIVVLGAEEEESPAALIRVQGLPDQVESVNTWSNCSSIVLLWDSGPTGLHSTYCVAVYNTTAARNSNASMEMCMLREPSFTLTDTEASPLHTFEFVVTTVSELGRGPPSSAVAANFTFDLPDQVESVNVWSNCSSIVLLWDPAPACLQQTYCVTVYNITAAPSTAHNSNASMEMCMLREPSFTLTDTGATPVHTFEFVVTAVSELGRGPPSSAITARFTFDTHGTCGAGATPTSSDAVVLIIIIGVAILVLLSGIFIILFVTCCIVISRGRCRRETSGGMMMTTCRAYENPIKCLDGDNGLQTLEKGCTSYETIPELRPEDHVYERIQAVL